MLKKYLYVTIHAFNFIHLI